MRTIRWGIIGCGDVTEVKSGPAFQKARHSSLTAVMRRNGDRARDYARRHGVPRWHDNAQALIRDPEVDAVYIATPPAFHKEYTLRSAQAGKPVYVEKPMALNFEECQRMVQVCREASVPLFVAYYRRALSRFLKVKELIDARAIGAPRFVTLTLCQPLALKISIPRPCLGGSFRKWRAAGVSWIWLRICWTFWIIFSARSARSRALLPIKPIDIRPRT